MSIIRFTRLHRLHDVRFIQHSVFGIRHPIGFKKRMNHKNAFWFHCKTKLKTKTKTSFLVFISEDEEKAILIWNFSLFLKTLFFRSGLFSYILSKPKAKETNMCVSCSIAIIIIIIIQHSTCTALSLKSQLIYIIIICVFVIPFAIQYCLHPFHQCSVFTAFLNYMFDACRSFRLFFLV